MKYLFVLGRQPEISLAEIVAVLGRGRELYKIEFCSPAVCVIDINPAIDVDFLISELGGTIKIGEVFGVVDYTNKDGMTRIKDVILKAAEEKIQNQKDKKLFFGLSGYGILDKKTLNILGLEIKKQLAALGIRARLVTSREPALSSVIVKTNKLLSGRGLELLLAGDKNRIWLARTLAVQPFDEYEKRDYGRPGRDVFSGMLPPKLAKILINLAGARKDAALLDPFCGSGTILTEAALMGYQNLLGSDVSFSAVAQTKENLEWFKIQDTRYLPADATHQALQAGKIQTCDCRKLSSCYKNDSVGAIITEPYLGPPLRGSEPPNKIESIIKELSELYLASFKEIHKVLKPGGVLVMVWPVFRQTKAGGDRFLPLLDKAEKIGFQNLITPRGTLVYARPDQRVGREIIKLKKTR